MHKIFLLILILSVEISFSQNDTIVKYYDADWKELTSNIEAKYYRIINEINDSTFLIKNYYIDGKIQMEGTYKTAQGKIRHGKFTFWFNNGQIMEKGEYNNGNKSGSWRKYYENGAFRSERIYSDTPKIFTKVEQMPEFPGGQDSLYKYIAHNIYYPPVAKDNKIEGTIYIKFVINADGSISDVTLLKGIGGGCDEEAIKVIKNMPNWIPGTQENKPVKVQFEIPLSFRL